MKSEVIKHRKDFDMLLAKGGVTIVTEDPLDIRRLKKAGYVEKPAVEEAVEEPAEKTQSEGNND